MKNAEDGSRAEFKRKSNDYMRKDEPTPIEVALECPTNAFPSSS